MYSKFSQDLLTVNLKQKKEMQQLNIKKFNKENEAVVLSTM